MTYFNLWAGMPPMVIPLSRKDDTTTAPPYYYIVGNADSSYYFSSDTDFNVISDNRCVEAFTIISNAITAVKLAVLADARHSVDDNVARMMNLHTLSKRVFPYFNAKFRTESVLPPAIKKIIEAVP